MMITGYMWSEEGSRKVVKKGQGVAERVVE